jgi:hypothetical protein
MRLINPVELRLPGSLYGGDPRGLIKHLGLHGRRISGDRWAVWPDEGKSFILCRDLADETGYDHRLDYLRETPDPTIRLDDADTLERIADLNDQLKERMRSGSDITAPFHQFQWQVMRTRNSAELENVVRDVYDSLGEAPIESTGEQAFPHRSAVLVMATDLLIRRARLPAIMFRFEQDPDAMKNITSLDDEAGAFGSSSEWYREIIGVTHYLGPLLGCLSPRFWCFPTGRPPFAVLFSLGTDINGQRNSPMEPMQLLPGASRDEPASHVELSPNACRHAIHWWATRLNQLFGYLSDPTTFANAEGVYDPYEHQHWLLTIGQLFGLTTALQASSRNYAVQRALMNTLLDTFADRIKGREFDKLCTFDTASRTADRVRMLMPDDVAQVLMPAADQAVQSLKRVDDGFFIRKQRGDANVVVNIPEDERPHHRQPQRATAVLLKVFRNATHGFGGLSPNPRNINDRVAERLLAVHTGDMPADLVFLPYLYLLELLSEPEKMRRVIVDRAAKRV